MVGDGGNYRVYKIIFVIRIWFWNWDRSCCCCGYGINVLNKWINLKGKKVVRDCFVRNMFVKVGILRII